MQVGLLPAAPLSLPGGVKVARRSVKPFGVGASPSLAAIFQGVLSVADGLAWNEEDGSAILSTLTILDGWQSSNASVLKTERASQLRGCNSYTIRHFFNPNERKSHETRHPLPEPVAPAQELQTQSYPNQTGEADLCVSSGALRSETANQDL